MPEDYAAFRARRQAELAADPTSQAELTGTRTSKPESTPVAHGPMRAVAPPPAKVDKATGKAVVNLDRAAEEEDAVASAHKSMSRGVQPLDMDAIKRADAELAGYDKKPKAEKEAIDSGRLAQAQKGLKEARVAPDIDSIVSRRAPEEAAPAPKRATRTRRQTGRVEVSHQAPAKSAEAPVAPASTESKAASTEVPSAPVAGSSQFSGMMAAHGSHGNLVNPEGPKPKLGKDITYFGAVGGPKAPEEGKRGGPAYNTQQAYQKHIAGGGTPDSYWSDRDAKAAGKKPKAAKPEVSETPVAAAKPAVPEVSHEPKAPAARTPESPKIEGMPTNVATERAGHEGRMQAAEEAHIESKKAKTVTPAAPVTDSGTKAAPSTAGRRSAPVAPEPVSEPKKPRAEIPAPGGGSTGPSNPEIGQRLMSQTPVRPTMTPSGSSTPERVSPSAAGREPSKSRSPRGGGNVPSPVSAGQQFGGEGVHHHHYYGPVNQGTGTQIVGNQNTVATDNASIGSSFGPGSGSGSQGGGGRGAGGTVNRGIVTGNPTGLQRAAYSAIHTKVNGHSIAGGVHHVTGGGHLGMNDSEGRPIGRPGDAYVQHHEMNAGHGKSGSGMGQHGDVQQGQFSRARASRQQATPTS